MQKAAIYLSIHLIQHEKVKNKYTLVSTLYAAPLFDLFNPTNYALQL